MDDAGRDRDLIKDILMPKSIRALKLRYLSSERVDMCHDVVLPLALLFSGQSEVNVLNLSTT